MTLEDAEKLANEVIASPYHGPAIDDPENKKDLALPAWHLARALLLLLPVASSMERYFRLVDDLKVVSRHGGSGLQLCCDIEQALSDARESIVALHSHTKASR